jgi:hypothetical protein
MLHTRSSGFVATALFVLATCALAPVAPTLGCSPDGIDLDVPSGLLGDDATEIPEPGEWKPDPNAPPPPPPDPSTIPEPPEWGPPATLDPATVPNPYVNLGVGVAISRPDSFVWLPESSMPDYAKYTERIPIDDFDPKSYAAPIEQPLISMASTPEAQWGRDVVAYLYARPFPYKSVTPGVGWPNAVGAIMAGLALREMTFAGYRQVEEAVAEDVDGTNGATVKIRYDVLGPNGEILPTTEEVWLTRIGRHLIFLNLIYPENADAETLEQVAFIRDSLRIDI